MIPLLAAASTPCDPPVAFSSPSHHPPRDLHSFPTRRSSDLRLHLGFWQKKLKLQDLSDLVGCLPRVEEALRELQTEDRKSTRLNSSHRCISYAVFCLKKKKVVARSVPPDAVLAP